MRFPEFSGEWEIHKLSEYLDFKNGLNPDAKRFGRGLPFISVMDILADRVVCYDNIRAKVEATDKEIECFGVNKGDLLFQRSSETFEDVGRANVYMDNRTAIYGGFVIRGRKIGNYDPLFFKYLLATPLARKRTCRMGAGAQHFNIGQEGLSKISLHFPSIEEQSKIANLFSLIDERVETQKKIIEDLKRLKYAISKRVFENHGSSNSMLLGKVADIYQPQTIPTSWLNDALQYPVYGANGVIGKYSEYNHENSQICIACRGNTCGTVNYSEPKSWITGNAMVINTDRYDVNKRFLFHQLCTVNYSTIISGSGQPQIVRAPLEKMKIWFPDEDVQERIATLFDTIEERVLIEETILILAERMKQYLLSQLFIKTS